MRRRQLGIALAGGAAVVGGWTMMRSGFGPAVASRRRARLRHPVFPAHPHAIAHRGGAALAPENTLQAFRQAVERWGADMLELDVRATADGHCVVLHDPDIDRTTDGSGRVEEMTLDQVRRLDAGYRFSPDEGRTFPFRGRGVRVPTIGEVIAAFPATPMIVEVKTGAAQAPLLEAVLEAGAEHRVIPAGERHADRTLLFDRLAGPVSASAEQLRAFYILHRMRAAAVWAPAADVANLPEYWQGRRVVTPRFVRDLHRHGIVVHVWTVNAPADMRRLLDWGVDGILTDRPDLLAALLAERAGRPRADDAAGPGSAAGTGEVRAVE